MKTLEQLQDQYKDILDCGFECLPGWANIIDTVLSIAAEIKETYDEPIVFLQIKEKFGGLRMYHSGADDYLAGAICMASCLSQVTCECCGARGRLRKNHGWVQTLCDEHDQRQEADDE
jgi:hypothetical protein